jgi:hypothetical protein
VTGSRISLRRPRPSGTSNRRVAAVGALAVTCLALSACAAVPTSGPIEEGPIVDAGSTAQFIRVIAAPPSVGASPSDIVRGFLEANASLDSGHAIARRYLTAEAAESWDPSAATTVYEQSSLELSKLRGSSITAEMAINNRLEANGYLKPIEPAEQAEVDFRLEQVIDSAGIPQWRIIDPPAGVLISDSDLRRAYRPHQVYQAALRSGVLVPDGRLLPVIGPSLPTALAERVLAGPASWLAPGIRGGAPDGTQLALGAVPVTDGVALVELTDAALLATEVQRQDLAAQMTWTLTQLSEVSGVRLQVGGEPYNVPGRPEVMDRSVFQDRSPDSLITGPDGEQRVPHYILVGTELLRVSDASRTGTAIDVPDADRLLELGVSLDQQMASAVTPDRRGLWMLPLDRGISDYLVTGRRIGGASFDIDGRAWFTDAGKVMRLGASRAPARVPVRGDDLAGRISSVHLARDGTRVVLVAGGQLYLGVLEGSQQGLAITSAHRLAVTVEGVVDVAWRNSTTLDVLGSTDSSGRQVLRISVSTGEALPIGAPPEPQEVAGAPGSATLSSTEADLLFANVGLQWRAQGDARSVTYPG